MAEQKGFFKKRKKILILAGVGAAILILIFVNMRTQREKTVRAVVDTVRSRNLTALISASGEIKPKKNVNISAHVPGRIIKIGVVEGEEVRAGDFLLQLDAAQYEANAERDRAYIRTFNAELIQAEARHRRDRNSYERQMQLFEEDLISKEQMETARVQFEVSEAQLKSIHHQIAQAEASLKSTLDNLSKTTYSAPIDGIITSLRVEEGEVAVIGTMNNPGTVLLTIADLSVMQVEVDVDETDVVGVTVGQKADVRVDAFPEMTFKGHVTEVGSSAVQRTAAAVRESRDFKVVITLDDPPAKLKPGLSATADIIAAERENVPAVPISAVVIRDIESESERPEAGETEGVYVVEEGRARFQPIVKGIMGGMMLEIVSGLDEGASFISGPYSVLRELKDGVLIRAEEKKAGQR
ncbi:MAG: efflux RND transporter periplasmic adaptor subunit [Acidobacteriota bacterium]|nr:efflux RND transporter periplasmic adaptor subunit [Acidobacteriota bacterium]